MQPIMSYETAALGGNVFGLPQEQMHTQSPFRTTFLSTNRVRENLPPLARPLPDQQPRSENGSSFRELRKQFELRDESVVRAYLRKYPFLFSLLFEAQKQVARVFGEKARMVLQVSVDPNDLSAQLFIVIPTQLDAKAALALFDQLDEEWWLEAAKRADFRLNFIPEFI